MDAMAQQGFDSACGKAADESCFTCYCPALDRPDAKNMFASVGFSDAALGRKQAAWRLELAAGEASPCSDTTAFGSSPSSMDAELARLLNDDDDDGLGLIMPASPVAGFAPSLAAAAGAARRAVVPGAISREEPDLLSGPLLGDNNNTCTTCWNFNAVLAERQVRGDYVLPETAMGLGSSRIMSNEERDFVGKLMAGGDDDDEPLEGLSRMAAQLGGLELPSPVASGDASDRSGATHLIVDDDVRDLSSSAMSTASVRAAKRSAADRDGADPQDECETKRPRRAAADRAAELARLAGRDETDEASHDAACESESPSSSSRLSVSRTSAPQRARGAGPCKGRQLPEWSVHILKEWLLSPEHFDYPWPTLEEKADLAERGGVDERQLGIWLTNARKRLWMPLRRRQGLSIPRYADAKAERVQRALVARVESEARRPAQPAFDAQPAHVDPLGASRVVAALHAANEQLRAEAAALEMEAAAVEARADMLDRAVPPQPAHRQSALPAQPMLPASLDAGRLLPVTGHGSALPLPFHAQQCDWDLGFGFADDDDLPLGLA